MNAVKELIAKYNAEEVGGRLIAVVNGRKEYIANVENGGFVLTAFGLMLEEQSQAEAPAPAPEKPKRRKKDADVSDDDLLAGIEV